jgi:leucyl-tRNA synthetase
MTVESGIANLKSQIEEQAKKDVNVAKWLERKTIKRVIFVEGKLVNFVT